MSKIFNPQLVIALLSIFGIIIILASYSEIENSDAQTYDKVISFPGINIPNSKNENYTLDENFLLITNNLDNKSQYPVEILNPNFSLHPPFVNLTIGQKYTVNPLNREDIQYNNVTIKLAAILSVAPGLKIQDLDPEDPDMMTLGGQTDIAHFVRGKGGNFVIPSNMAPGKYILYTYLQYPYGITGVFSNFATINAKSPMEIPSSSTELPNNNANMTSLRFNHMISTNHHNTISTVEENKTISNVKNNVIKLHVGASDQF